MILALHRLRRDEEGQTLVLAAIFGLILALCVLGTVNVGRAVYDKMQLQTAADGAAYSQAAVGARVMNFTAYTNRAMVVHYASIMAMSAYLTFFHFLYSFAGPALKVLQFVPYIGPIIKAAKQFIETVIRIMDIAVAALTPVISAFNVVLYGLQEGAWLSFTKRLLTLPPEAHSGDSGARPYKGLGFGWDTLLLVANQASWAQARGHTNVIADAAETWRVVLNDRSDVVQEARMHMVEVANSARQPWTAYGDRATKRSWVPGARHFWWGPSWGGAGFVARTELGSFQPTGNFFGDIARGSGQVWSADRLELAIQKRFLFCNFDLKMALFTTVTMDRFFPFPGLKDNSYALDYKSGAKGICSKVLEKLLSFLGFGGIQAVGQILKKEAEAGFNRATQTRLFWISPYVYYAPRSSAKPGIGPFGKPGNFAQPDFIVGLNKSAGDYNAAPGARNLFGRRFVSQIGGAAGGRGTTDFTMARKAALPTLPDGLNAFSAAQVYYHRPGDWKEQPNLFNPLWGARLMPLMESNTAAKVGLVNNSFFKQFVLH